MTNRPNQWRKARVSWGALIRQWFLSVAALLLSALWGDGSKVKGRGEISILWHLTIIAALPQPSLLILASFIQCTTRHCDNSAIKMSFLHPAALCSLHLRPFIVAAASHQPVGGTGFTLSCVMVPANYPTPKKQKKQNANLLTNVGVTQ